MKKIFSLISMFMICLCGMAADDATTLQENHHIYPVDPVSFIQAAAVKRFQIPSPAESPKFIQIFRRSFVHAISP